MKLSRLLAVLMALLFLALTAQADTWYVYTENGKTLNLRSPANKAVIGNIPYGTRLETDNQLSTETAAYVTWAGFSGFVNWSGLVKDPPPERDGRRTPPQATPIPQTETLLPTDGEGVITLQALGAYIEYTSKKAGKYSAVSFDKPVKVKITADVPRNKTIEYWVIDGIRYDFKPKVPTSFTLENVTDNMIVEAVIKGKTTQTLFSADAIQQIRTGDTLEVKTVNAKLSHVKKDLTASGGWITNFDFTEDYTNKATKKKEAGGQVTVRIKATVPKGKKINYWKFDSVKIDFDKAVTEMVVHMLNVSKTYEPVFGTTASKTSTNSEQQPVQEYFTVTCKGCTFSGGGHTNATSGQVPAGSQIKVTNKTGSQVKAWRINGVVRAKTVNHPVDGEQRVNITANSITLTVNWNSTIVCTGE